MGHMVRPVTADFLVIWACLVMPAKRVVLVTQARMVERVKLALRVKRAKILIMEHPAHKDHAD